ncbi:hypothetical protein COCSUDRAFT_57532 [Coccomyxa subellipsoidea C-169]|uniref:Uncharacterized protein n=1 Tax=Coccomyxa subellipsoidea (strain C-169) TaxID=574566 RepID=I0YPR2_COCSC|nr:hypothetical protein COCSUDRAFT_57532 [Coccomyxa subellipsoidea C-169]EIE20381.1 hypothetical protein COCSUDRAFT_57532 [Coccomyxa subellipsoidea C-169]|eukprot:XP_005644925.1 hypothetical protein COCSUDRAFT_57532 [Coccomyxa subellipsoidea C-169]
MAQHPPAGGTNVLLLALFLERCSLAGSTEAPEPAAAPSGRLLAAAVSGSRGEQPSAGMKAGAEARRKLFLTCVSQMDWG